MSFLKVFTPSCQIIYGTNKFPYHLEILKIDKYTYRIMAILKVETDIIA